MPDEITEGLLGNYQAIQTAGPKWDFVARDLTALSAALRVDLKCLEWLQSRIGVEQLHRILDNLHSQFAVAGAFYNKDGSVDEDYATTDDLPGRPFRIVLNYPSYSADNATLRWDTLLHELAHVLDPEGFIQDDGGNEAAQEHNQKLLDANCFQTLRQARERP
jgi:hypothetical protein